MRYVVYDTTTGEQISTSSLPLPESALKPGTAQTAVDTGHIPGTFRIDPKTKQPEAVAVEETEEDAFRAKWPPEKIVEAIDDTTKRRALKADAVKLTAVKAATDRAIAEEPALKE